MKAAIAKPVAGDSAILAASPDGTRRALFLDRDGIVNVNHGYVHTAAATEWVPGVFDLARAAHRAGYLLVVATATCWWWRPTRPGLRAATTPARSSRTTRAGCTRDSWPKARRWRPPITARITRSPASASSAWIAIAASRGRACCCARRLTWASTWVPRFCSAIRPPTSRRPGVRLAILCRDPARVAGLAQLFGGARD